MNDRKWKVLILSIIFYQGLLTWGLFSFANINAYLSRINCDDCREQLFGFILSNQSGYETSLILAIGGGLLAALNAAIWIGAAAKRDRNGREAKVGE